MKRILSILFLVANLIFLAGCTIKAKLEGAGTTRQEGTVAAVIPPVRAPLRFKSLVDSWVKQADITNNASLTNIYTIYNAQKNQLPQTGSVVEMTSSAFQAMFVVAGQVCGALKDKEVALTSGSRVAFKSLNFSPASTALTRDALVSDQAIRETADALSLTFLGRLATDEEKIEFVRAAAQVFLGVTITAQNNSNLVQTVAVILCTGVAVSGEAISI